jgi:histidinol-phosphate aminotransferase
MSGSAFFSPVVAGLTPYVPGEQPRIANLVKLNTNENPYPPSARVVQAITTAARQGLQLYPDPESTALRQAVARHHGIDASQVFVGNGSDEVLAHAFFAFFQQGKPLLMPDVSYSFYAVYCRLYGIAAQMVPLDAAMQIDVRGYAAANAGGVVIANPNAPTGCALALGEVEQLLQSQPGCVVLLDEAYVDFGAASAIRLLDRYPNLLVVHTLSKSRSLAGLRVGLAFGQRPLVDALERVKNSFNSYPLDRLAQAGAVAAYEDTAYFEQTRAPSSVRARAWWRSCRAWTFRSCRRRPISCWPATPRRMPPRWPRGCARWASWCGTSGCRASSNICASASARQPSATPWCRHWAGSFSSVWAATTRQTGRCRFCGGVR